MLNLTAFGKDIKLTGKKIFSADYIKIDSEELGQRVLDPYFMDTHYFYGPAFHYVDYYEFRLNNGNLVDLDLPFTTTCLLRIDKHINTAMKKVKTLKDILALELKVNLSHRRNIVFSFKGGFLDCRSDNPGSISYNLGKHISFFKKQK